MTKLHFNYKDIFRAFRLGFSAKKIWVGFQGLLFGWLGYMVLGYLAYLVSGTGIAAVWENFRLLPMPDAVASLPAFNVGGWILWAVGVVWLVFTAMTAGVAISKLTYEQLRGDEFFEVKEAWKQALKSLGALIATPVLLGLFIVLLLAAGLLLGLIGRIPYAGEMIVGLLAIPAFAVALFVVYLIVVFFFTFTISSAVIGTTKSDAFDNLFEVFSCVNDQPWRLVWYQFLLVVFAIVGMAVLAFFSVKAIHLGRWIVGILMNVGEAKASTQILYKLDFMINSAADTVRLVLPRWVEQAFFWLPNWVHGSFAWIKGAVALPSLVSSQAAMIPNWSVMVGTILFSIFYHVFILFVLSYGMAVWFSGNTLVYLVLVKKKDERNLLEIKEEEIEIPEKLEVTTPAEEAKPTPKKKAPTKKKPTAKKTTRKTKKG